MKKWIAGGVCAALLSFGSIVYASDAVQALLFPVTVFIKGSGSGSEDLTALNYNGSIYVPLRYIAERFGAEVTYYGESKSIAIDAKLPSFMKSDMGDGLPNYIGDPSYHNDGLVYQRDVAGVNLAEKTGYGGYTGVWFTQYGREGKMGYSLSSGSRKSGSEVGFEVNQAPSGVKIRIRLSKLDKDFRPVAIVKEHVADTQAHEGPQTLFSTFLPSEPNTLYLLSAEALGPDGQPEDTVLSAVYVPAQEMNASISTDKLIYSPGEPLILSFRNAGPSEISYGFRYELEQWKDGQWYMFPLNEAWFDTGGTVEPGETKDEPVTVPVLEKGRYRIIKQFRSEAAGWNAALASEFTVE